MLQMVTRTILLNSVLGNLNVQRAGNDSLTSSFARAPVSSGRLELLPLILGLCWILLPEKLLIASRPIR